MRHTTEELLLAATVRAQAVELREVTFTVMRNKKFTDPDLSLIDLEGTQEYRDWEIDWIRANPLDLYVQKVLARLDKVADMVKRHQAGR